MNLFHNPCLSQLSALVAQCSDFFNYYHLVVEHDGEVLIELSSKNKNHLLPKYRFYFKDFLYGKNCVGFEAARNLQYLNQLYKNLMYCWENELSGSVNFNEITEIQHVNYRIMMNSAAQEMEKVYAPALYRIGYRDFPQLTFFK